MSWIFTKFCILFFQGRCNREKPPCKYFHPPQHLKDQLLINGRNHLALKNALMQQMGYMSQPFLAGAGQFPSIVSVLIILLVLLWYRLLHFSTQDYEGTCISIGSLVHKLARFSKFFKSHSKYIRPLSSYATIGGGAPIRTALRHAIHLAYTAWRFKCTN
jgi:hypothetical protein